MAIAQPITSSGAALYGLVAEYDGPEALVNAARRVREAGYRRMDAYTPFPVHGLAEALGFTDAKVPWIVFMAGLIGAVAGLGLQYYASAVYYPLNVGGRPYLSLPAFVPVTFECTVLFASFGAVIGMLALNGLPRPHHSVFNAPGFERASQDGFFLCVEAADERFDRAGTADLLRDLGALSVHAVDR